MDLKNVMCGSQSNVQVQRSLKYLNRHKHEVSIRFVWGKSGREGVYTGLQVKIPYPRTPFKKEIQKCKLCKLIFHCIASYRLQKTGSNRFFTSEMMSDSNVYTTMVHRFQFGLREGEGGWGMKEGRGE